MSEILRSFLTLVPQLEAGALTRAVEPGANRAAATMSQAISNGLQRGASEGGRRAGSALTTAGQTGGRDFSAAVEGQMRGRLGPAVATALRSASSRATAEGQSTGSRFAGGVEAKVKSGRLDTSMRGLFARAKAIAGADGKTAGSRFASSVTGQLSKLSGAVGLGGLLAGGGLLGFAKSSIDQLKATTGAATGLRRVIGGTVEDASRLNFAAQQSGVDTALMAKSMGILSKNIGEVGGKAGPGAKALAALGISTKDAQGKTRSMAELLPDIADKFKSMPAGADKSALALKLFGKAGLGMIPFLDKGKAGIADLMKQSDKFGTTVGSKQADAVKKAAVAQRQFSAAMDGLKVQVGNALLPALTKFLGFFRDKLAPVLMAAGKRLGDALAPIASTALTIVDNFDRWKGVLLPVAGVVLGLAAAIKTYTTVTRVVTAVTKAWQIAQAILNGTMALNPIGLAVVAGLALAAVFVLLWKRSETFRNIVTGAWNGIRGAAQFVWNWMSGTLWPGIKGVWDKISGGFIAAKDKLASGWDSITTKFSTAWTWVKTTFSANWQTILGILTGPVGWAWLAIRGHWDSITSKFTSAKSWVSGAFSAAWRGAKAVLVWPLEQAKASIVWWWDQITSKFTSAKSWVSGAFSAAWRGAKAVLVWPLEQAKASIVWWWDQITSKFTSAKSWVVGAFKREWDGLKKLLTDPVDAAKTVIERILGKEGLQKVFSTAVAAVGRIWDGLKKLTATPINAVIRIINDPFIAGFNKLASPFGLTLPSIPVIPGYARGGILPGTSSWRDGDDQLATLRRGEGVSVSEMLRDPYERTRLLAANKWAMAGRSMTEFRERFEGFALGGIVGGGSGGFTPFQDRLINLGFLLRRLGFTVQEGPGPFGPVHPVHRNNSDHYRGNALDVNWSPTSQEPAKMDAILSTVWKAGFGTMWRVPGHFDHLHIGPAQSVLAAGGSYNGQGGGNMTGTGTATGGFSIPNPFDAIKNILTGPLSGLVSRFPGSFTGTLLSGLAKKLVGSAVSKGFDLVTSMFTDASTGNVSLDDSAIAGTAVGRWAPLVRRSLAMNGLPTSEAYVSAWLRQINTESGGNEKAIQGIVDVNSRSGNLARGLLQVIPPTFAAYHFKGFDQIMRGFDNMLAAMNYAKNRYGVTEMLGAIGRGHGYAAGTRRAQRGLSVVGENGWELVDFGGGERVYSHQESVQLQPQGAAAAGPTLSFHGVPMDSAGDLADKVLLELRRADRAGRYAGVAG
ncbi:hypothetical protein G9U51_08270 [Calidifontibacter sp. DB0510]|uniref:Transglycosylase SLT domain-containing protein n=1 Tax=Metallococcus carri TaxID=1656884 RepID=A0A967EA05_9MICO|nr:hypothetical protein [Metallococcus carri]NHN55770.1 hypothetical protein [Metallococcus carri]NOP38541.1 hypothetical protein [Calidifontibacter sp. DB2511S]